MIDVRGQLVAWARDGDLAHEDVGEALRAAGVTPTPAQWRAFLERLLVWLGAVLLAAAATYFVAANWQALGRFGKFALVEGGLVVAVAIAWWRGIDSLAGRAALLAAALVTGVLLALVGQVYQTGADPFELFAFWAAFILTRPLGAVVGDFLDKPVAKGGLELNRYTATAALLVFIVGCIVVFPQRAAAKAH